MDKHFYISFTAVLLLTIILIVIGIFLNSISALIDVLSGIIGILFGFVISYYFTKRSAQQDLGRFAKSGLRLSIDIYDSLKECIDKIEEFKTSHLDEKNITKDHVTSMLEIVDEKLKVIQRFSLSANHHWKEVLPPEELLELDRREEIIDISKNRQLQITQEKHKLTSPDKRRIKKK